MATNKPSSNKQDKARMGPNADRGSTAAAGHSGSAKSAARGDSAGQHGGSMRGSSQSGMRELDAGADMTGQDAATSGRGGSGARASGAASHSMGSSESSRSGTRSQGSGSGMGSSTSERIGEVMTRQVRLANPDQTIRQAAEMMADADVGSLPVGENDRLIGMITDRDIVLRAVAEGRDANTTVREVMTDRIQYCYEDDSIDDVARNMADLGVRRLPVINRDKRLVGIVALSNITHCSNVAAKETFLDSVAAPH